MLLSALCLTLYLPGLSSIPPVDRDEARFAQTTRQMIESGDFVRPRFQAEDRFRKPIGIYWLQALTVSLTGAGLDRIWAYRVPSVVAGITAVLLTYHFGAIWYASAVALTGAALLAASLLLVVEAHLATTDAVLLALIVAAQGCLGVLYVHARRGRLAPPRYAMGFWIAQGLAMLVKGPVAPMIGMLTIATLTIADRRESWRVATVPGARFVDNLRWHWGVWITLLIVLPWGIAIAQRTGGEFYRDWLSTDLVPKLLGGHESHGAPPGTHLLLLAATFWPGSIALVPALLLARARRGRMQERLLLAWLVPAWIVFELMPTKLPHYVLPLLPPLALLCARAMLSTRLWQRGTSRWIRGGIVTWTVVGISASVMLVVGPMKLGEGTTPLIVAGATALAICVLLAARWAFAARWRMVIPVACAASLVLSMTAFGSMLPGANAFWLSQRAAMAIAERRQGSVIPLAAAGYHEPSLVFLSSGDITLLGPAALATFMHLHTDGLGLITADERQQFDDAAAALGIAARVVWTGDGINYSKGQPTRLLLLERLPTEMAAQRSDAAPADHQALLAR